MAGYIRQDTTNNIADGNVINASDFDNEYNAIEAAFNASTGHTHDGTSTEGAPITKIGPTQDVVASASALTPKTDNTVDLGSSTLEYKDLFIDGTANIDSLVADTADINAGTIDGVTIGGASAGAGTFTALTTSSTVTLNAGTANGVLYLNGSKVATSGSALTFDGTNNLLFDASASSDQANFRVRTNTTGGVSNAYFNLNGTDYFRISTESTQTGLRNLTNTPLYFSINNTEQMRLTSTGLEVKQSQLIGYSSYAGIGTNGLAVAGNVGIGTSSPTQKLDVVGNIRGSGNLFAGFGNANASVQVLSSVSAGGAGNSELYFGNATNSTQGYLSYSHSTNALLFGTNTTTQMTLNSSGNLGLGVPPSAWRSGDRALDIGSTASLVDAQSANTRLYNNTFVATGGTNTYKITAAASYYDQGGGAHRWFTAPSGTAGNAISFTQAMTLDASGNLLVGTTSNTEGAKLNVQNGYVFVKESGGGDLYIRSGVGAGVDPAIQVASNDPLLFYTNNTERARITSGGDLLVGTTSTTSGARLDVKGVDSTGSNYCMFFENSSNALLLAVQNDGRWRSGTAAASPYNYTVGATNRDLFVDNIGEIGYVSSVRASKTNIAPVSNVEWLLRLNPVTFNFRKKDAEGNYTEQADGPLKHGLIAEDVEVVNPDLCFYDDAEQGGTLRGVNYTHLITPMLKLIQEQQALITDLRARVAALEA